MKMEYPLKLVSCFILLSTFFSCATYQSKVTPARDLLVKGECSQSLQMLEGLAKVEGADQLVYLLDYASALQICSQYKKSNEFFLKAEKLADQQDYHSVSKIAGATLFNEEMVQYKGDTFEKLFINVSLAFNYLQLGAFDDALVEVRKINQKYVKLQGEEKKNFELNAFASYLAGLLWEVDKNYDAACIDYQTSFFLDQNYRSIALNMLKACHRARRTDEYNKLVKKIGATESEIALSKKPNSAELILVVMQGWGPRKAPRPGAPTFPHLVSVRNETQSVQAALMNSTGTKTIETYESEPIYSFEQAAIKTLDADYNSLVARRIGSRVAKEVVADQIRQKDQVLGAIAWVGMVASERADLRQWSIYPKAMQVIRIPLKAGNHKIKLTGLNFNKTESETFPDLDFNISEFGKKIQLIRTLK